MGASTPSAARKPFKWGFFSAGALCVALMLLGTVVRWMLASFARDGLGLRGFFFIGFTISALAFCWLQRAAVLRFLRSMYTGVTLVSMVVVAIVIGVLVPQVEGFEDPERRVTASTYAEDYSAFRWAEGYFLYHILHLYGIGMPQTELPAPSLEGIERYARRYGEEEGQNREKQMVAAFSGREKTAEIGAFIERHDGAFRRAFDVCTTLHLNRLYKSHWFAALLTLLFVAVLANTFRGPWQNWLTARKAGWMTVHIGILTLLVGGLVSNTQTHRGVLHLDLREPPKDVYWGYFDREKQTQLPFHVKLDHYARRDWKSLQVHFPEESFQSSPPTYTLWPGRRLELDFVVDEHVTDPDQPRPRIRLEVEALHERAVVQPPKFWESESDDDRNAIGALCELVVTDWEAAVAHDHDVGEEHEHEKIVFVKPDWPNAAYYDPQWKFRVLSSFGDDRAEAVALLDPPERMEGILGYLSMRVAAEGDVRDRIVPIRLGEEVEGPAGYAISVVEATANFRVDPRNPTVEIRDPRPLAEQFPRNPAVWVNITPPSYGDAGAVGETERRPILERLDAEENELQSRFRYPELVLKFEYERWWSAGPPRYVLHWGSDGTGVLIDEAGDETPAPPGRALPVPGDTVVVPQKFLANAHFERELEFSDPLIAGPQYDPSFYSRDPTGLEVRVVHDPGTSLERVDEVRLASTEQGLSNVWEAGDGRFWIHYFENDRAFPFEWRSVLSVWDEDQNGTLYQVDIGDESSREIRVNDYLHYRGYRFFQTNAIPELPTYSGIGVVYDPGIPVVLFGMYTIIAGTILAFMVRPVVEAVALAKKRGAT